MQETRPSAGAGDADGTHSTGGPGTGTEGSDSGAGAGAAFADCVVCGGPTEHPATTSGATLCPVCAWQEAERRACSG